MYLPSSASFIRPKPTDPCGEEVSVSLVLGLYAYAYSHSWEAILEKI